MVIATEFDDWQQHPPPDVHVGCSPNLLLVLGELQRRWEGLTNLGCYGVRPIRGSTTVLSSHANGAAIDVGYPAEFDDTIAAQVCPFLVARSGELDIDAVHDYRRCRIWRAGRTDSIDDACTNWWKAQRPDPVTGMGQRWANHLHLEVCAPGWANTTPISERWAE